jgi:hypothetical protein
VLLLAEVLPQVPTEVHVAPGDHDVAAKHRLDTWSILQYFVIFYGHLL